MMRQYKEIKSSYTDILLFFQMGDFFELFFEDAIKAAPIMDVALTKKGDVPMCGVPIRSYENYLIKLLESGFKVAICEQLEEKNDSKLLKRGVVRIITPGTISEDSLLKGKANNFIVSIMEGNKLGIAISDVSTGFVGLEEIEKEDIFDFLYKNDPSEILAFDGILDSSYWKPIDHIWKKKLTILPKVKFSYQSAVRKILDLYKVNNLDPIGDVSDTQISAFGALIDYLNLTDQRTLKSLSWPNIKKESKNLIVDASTKSNLELIKTLYGESKGSLRHKIDHTLTAGGGRLFLKRLLNPSVCPNMINKNLSNVEKFVLDKKNLSKVRECLKHCQDGERSISRLCMGRLSPKDLSNIKNILLVQRNLDIKIVNSDLLELLEAALEEGHLSNSFELGVIKVGFHAELDSLRNINYSSKEQISSLQEKYRYETGINNLKLNYNNIIGYYIEISSSYNSKVPDWFIHKQTMSGKTRYTTTELINKSKALEDHESKLFRIEKEIFEKLIFSVCIHEKEIRTLSTHLSELDVHSSLAFLSINNNYCKPIIDNSTDFIIKDGRHPVLDSENFIPNSCVFDENHKFYIMTGPNMAGKSTFLRQNALILIMSHMGSFVPASYAKIGVVDRIFSRIGASDNLASGKSTFMVEMIETATILRHATPRSFVILDEVGRGTSTFDGLAIAYAVSEELIAKTKCKTLFATHYFELVEICKIYEKVFPITMSIQEWEDNIIFLHTVKNGSAEKSYGIHVAKLAGVPSSVINRSLELLKQFEAA